KRQLLSEAVVPRIVCGRRIDERGCWFCIGDGVVRVRGCLKIRHSLRSGCLWGQRYSLARSSHSKSLLDSVPSSRCVLSHTGTCGAIPLSLTIQPSSSALP